MRVRPGVALLRLLRSTGGLAQGMRASQGALHEHRVDECAVCTRPTRCTPVVGLKNSRAAGPGSIEQYGGLAATSAAHTSRSPGLREFIIKKPARLGLLQCERVPLGSGCAPAREIGSSTSNPCNRSRTPTAGSKPIVPSSDARCGASRNAPRTKLSPLPRLRLPRRRPPRKALRRTWRRRRMRARYVPVLET